MYWLKQVGTRELVFVACPHCDEVLNLQEDETRIKLRATIGGTNKDGVLYLSAFWEDYTSSEEGIEIGSGDVCTILCPHCGKSLQAEETCKVCGAATSVFKFASGAVGICNRKGCKMHLRSVDAEIILGDRIALSVSAWGGPYERL